MFLKSKLRLRKPKRLVRNHLTSTVTGSKSLNLVLNTYILTVLQWKDIEFPLQLFINQLIYKGN